MMINNDENLGTFLTKIAMNGPKSDVKKWVFLKNMENTRKWRDAYDPDVIITEILDEEQNDALRSGARTNNDGAEGTSLTRIDFDSIKSDLLAQMMKIDQSGEKYKQPVLHETTGPDVAESSQQVYGDYEEQEFEYSNTNERHSKFQHAIVTGMETMGDQYTVFPL